MHGYKPHRARDHAGVLADLGAVARARPHREGLARARNPVAEDAGALAVNRGLDELRHLAENLRSDSPMHD